MEYVHFVAAFLLNFNRVEFDTVKIWKLSLLFLKLIFLL